jgi:hypothetical protein
MNWWTPISPFVSPILAAIGGSVAVSAVVLKSLADRMLDVLKNRDSKDREGIAHERSKLLAERQNAFSMGANSHMASVVFDKYIGFCEEYVEAMSNALYTLIQEGNSDQPLDARDFFKIRQKWALWLSHEIDDKLDGFEHNFTRIGVDAPFFDANGAPASVPNELNIKQVIAALRESISTEEFATLRRELIRSLTMPPQVP